MNIVEVHQLTNKELENVLSELIGKSAPYCSDLNSIYALEENICWADTLRYRDYLITLAGSKYFTASARIRAEAYFLTFQNLSND